MYMPKRVAPGLYEVGEKRYENARGKGRVTNSSTILVAKGEAVNEKSSGSLGRINGLSKSKWYVVERVPLMVAEYVDDGVPYNPGHTERMLFYFADKEFSSKSKAVEYATRNHGMSETY